MAARKSKSLFAFLAAPFQLACYGFVWLCCGFFIWNLLLKGMFGDSLIENLQSISMF